MFGLGVSEIVIIAIVIIVLVHPKDLPDLSRKAGRLYASVMRQINDARRTFKDLEKEINILSDLDSPEEKNKSRKNKMRRKS